MKFAKLQIYWQLFFCPSLFFVYQNQYFLESLKICFVEKFHCQNVQKLLASKMMHINRKRWLPYGEFWSFVQCFISYSVFIISFLCVLLYDLQYSKLYHNTFLFNGYSTSFATNNILQLPQMLPNVALCAKKWKCNLFILYLSFHTFVNSIEIVWI